MATMRELKERINSVHSSQKITGAMKMISSARLRKAENRLLQAMPYRRQLWQVYAHIEQSDCEYKSPLAEERDVRRLALVIYASDDGLCGAFNIGLYKKLVAVIQEYRASGVSDITVYPIGRKLQYDIGRLKGVHFGVHPDSYEQKDYVRATREFADELTEKFLAKEYDRVEVIYSHFKSIGVQTVMSRQFLPVVVDEQAVAQVDMAQWYIYEPDCETVLKMLYPLMLHALMYEVFMENRTSEQAARILAMQLANDNAVKLLGNLQVEYNKLRQQGITTELLDIAGGGRS